MPRWQEGIEAGIGCPQEIQSLAAELGTHSFQRIPGGVLHGVVVGKGKNVVGPDGAERPVMVTAENASSMLASAKASLKAAQAGLRADLDKLGKSVRQEEAKKSDPLLAEAAELEQTVRAAAPGIELARSDDDAFRAALARLGGQVDKELARIDDQLTHLGEAVQDDAAP